MWCSLALKVAQRRAIIRLWHFATFRGDATIRTLSERSEHSVSCAYRTEFMSTRPSRNHLILRRRDADHAREYEAGLSGFDYPDCHPVGNRSAARLGSARSKPRRPACSKLTEQSQHHPVKGAISRIHLEDVWQFQSFNPPRRSSWFSLPHTFRRSCPRRGHFDPDFAAITELRRCHLPYRRGLSG